MTMRSEVYQELILLGYSSADALEEVEKMDFADDIEDYETFSDFEIDDYVSNAPCDNAGFCIGSTCKNYFSVCNKN